MNRRDEVRYLWTNRNELWPVLATFFGLMLSLTVLFFVGMYGIPEYFGWSVDVFSWGTIFGMFYTIAFLILGTAAGLVLMHTIRYYAQEGMLTLPGDG